MEHCPGDLWVVARNGSAVVSWDEPEFSDNIGISNVVERSGHRPGQSLLWGTYHIAYVAYDQAGNSATCSFKVYVLCKFIAHDKLPCLFSFVFIMNNLIVIKLFS